MQLTEGRAATDFGAALPSPAEHGCLSRRYAVGAGVLFVVLATGNAAGYRYGVSDQAFYIPAVVEQLVPDAFPRDRALLDAQGALTIVDELFAAVCRTTGLSLPVVCAAAYVIALALLWTALVVIGGRLYASRWSTIALGLALTLRHRVTRTGANTLEGYFHPRMLAFSLGALALGAYLWRRPWTAVGLTAVAALIHPTTAIWFAVLLGPAIYVSERARRPFLVVLAGVVLVVAAWALTGPMRDRLAIMDNQWISAFADKDYVFPTAWPLEAWVLNLMLPVLAGAVWYARTREHVAAPVETGLMAGAAALLLVFLISLPFIALRVALAVQLQTSRVFWLLDLIATAYLVSWLVDRPAMRLHSRRWGQIVLGALALLSVARAGYITVFEHPERGFARLDLPRTEWQDAMNWLRSQPISAQVLADPGHSYKYETTVRIAAMRDVFTEPVKDGAIALYSREVAMRVIDRRDALGDFDRLTPEHARALAARYDLDFLVTEADLRLPLAYRNGQFRVYALRRGE